MPALAPILGRVARKSRDVLHSFLRNALRVARGKRRQVRDGESVLWRTAARLRAVPARQALQLRKLSSSLAAATENIRVN